MRLSCWSQKLSEELATENGFIHSYRCPWLLARHTRIPCCLSPRLATPSMAPMAAAAAVPMRLAACSSPTVRTNWWRPSPSRRAGGSRSAARAEMDDGDYCSEAQPPGSVVPAARTTPGAAKLPVKGPLLSTDLPLDTERSNVRVTYQGSPGTVIEAMVLKAFPICIAVPHKRSEGALEAVESSLADKAVLTIENSSIGSFHQSYDLLLSHNLQIVQEVQMDVQLCLLASPGVQKDDIQTIFSHPQIISKQNLRDAGVIGNARVAELYGLNILECNFQTSIVFGLEEGPGTLYKALVAFWKRDLNLTKIESRPNRGKPMRTLGTEKKSQVSCVSLAATQAQLSERHQSHQFLHLEDHSEGTAKVDRMRKVNLILMASSVAQ